VCVDIVKHKRDFSFLRTCFFLELIITAMVLFSMEDYVRTNRYPRYV